jgi:hypothetical protein
LKANAHNHGHYNGIETHDDHEHESEDEEQKTIEYQNDLKEFTSKFDAQTKKDIKIDHAKAHSADISTMKKIL